MDILGTAQRLPDETLFPAALSTDAADDLPVDLPNTLADAGLYRLTGPRSARDLEADFQTVWLHAQCKNGLHCQTGTARPSHLSHLPLPAPAGSLVPRTWIPASARKRNPAR
jgi:hypothetical protein